MADIFLSYSRTDKPRVAPLVAALEAKGWSVWWDTDLAPGVDFDSVTAEALNTVGAVVVVWTPTSVTSRWVRGEARVGADRGVLVPVRFENAQLPIDVRAIHTTDLDNWNGDPDYGAFQTLAKSLSALLGAGATPNMSPPREPVSAAAGHTTPSAAAWAMIQDSLDPAEYEDFEALYPGTTEVILARRHRRQVVAWAGVEKTSPAAILAFEQTPQLFAALKGAASSRVRQLQTRAAEEEAAAQVAAAQYQVARQAEMRTAPRSKPGALWRERIPGFSATTSPEMVTLPAGRFLMGSPQAEERWPNYDGREEPQHEVRIGYALALGRYAVTVEEFSAFVGETDHDMGKSAYIFNGAEWIKTPGKGWRDPGFSQTTRDPVCCVSWHDAQAYIAWLNQKLGLAAGPGAYRLPTEAEWEYACRAGTTTPFSCGATISTQQANCDGRSVYGAGKKGDHRAKTTPVGSYPSNAFGLCDMHGNVFEWCEDVYHDTYDDAPKDGSARIADGESSIRVVRGGSWVNHPDILRSAYRGWITPTFRGNNNGFRLARTHF